MAEEQAETAPDEQAESAAELSPIDGLIAELDAFEPTDDTVDNEEKLQIWVDRWEESPDKELALPAIFRVFERNAESMGMGEPGPLVHAVEQVPGYEQELAASLDRAPSYYGVWMVNRILSSELPPEVRKDYLAILRKVAESETAPWSVKSTAQEFLEFQEG